MKSFISFVCTNHNYAINTQFIHGTVCINRTKAALELGVSSCDSSVEISNILEKAMRDDAHWMDLNDIDKTCTRIINNIHHYFIKQKVCKDQVTAS